MTTNNPVTKSGALTGMNLQHASSSTVDSDLADAAKRITALHDQQSGGKWKNAFFSGLKGAHSGKRKGDLDGIKKGVEHHPKSRETTPQPNDPSPPHDVKSNVTLSSPMRKANSMMNIGKKAASIIASSIMSVRSFVGSTNQKFDVDDENTGLKTGNTWYKKMPTEIVAYVRPNDRFGFDVGGSSEASREAEIDRAMEECVIKEDQYRNILLSSLEKMRVARKRTPEAKPLLDDIIKVFKTVYDMSLKVKDETVRQNYLCLAIAETMSDEMELFASKYHTFIKQINELWKYNPQFAKDIDGIHKYLLAPIERFFEYYYMLTRVEYASRNGMDKKDSGRASYIANSGFFSAKGRMNIAFAKIRKSLYGSRLTDMDSKLLNFYNLPWDLSKIQYTDENQDESSFRRLFLYLSKPTLYSFHLIPAPPVKVGELAGRHIKKITAKKDGSGYKVGHNAFGSVWTLHLLTDCLLVTKMSTRRPEMPYLLFNPVALENASFDIKDDIFSVKLSDHIEEFHISQDVYSCYEFDNLHKNLIIQNKQPRDEAELFSIPEAPVPPAAFGHISVDVEEIFDEGWYHVLSDGSNQVVQRIFEAPSLASHKTLESVLPVDPQDLQSDDKVMGLHICTTYYAKYLANEDLFIPIHSAQSSLEEGQGSEGLEVMPTVPRLPNYISVACSIDFLNCFVYIDASTKIPVGPVSAMLVESGPKASLINECRLICRSKLPGSPILLNHVIGGVQGTIRPKTMEVEQEAKCVELMHRWNGTRWLTPYRMLADSEEDAIAFVTAIQTAQSKVAYRAQAWRAHVQQKKEEQERAELEAAALAIAQEHLLKMKSPELQPSNLTAFSSSTTLQGEVTESMPSVNKSAPLMLKERPPEYAKSASSTRPPTTSEKLLSVKEQNIKLSTDLIQELTKYGEIYLQLTPLKSSVGDRTGGAI